MALATRQRDPATAGEEERPAIAALDRLLAHYRQRHNGASDTSGEFRLMTPDGAEVTLPPSAARLLQTLVYHLARDRAVAVVPLHKELTTQEAADLLNVSRPHLITLLEQGAIPYTRPGKHRRLAFDDVMAYKQRRDAATDDALDDLARLSQDLGLYR